MEIANRFRLTVDTYGYKLEKHIHREYDDENGHHVSDYWGNTKYPSTVAEARRIILENIEHDLIEHEDYINFSNAVDKMEQLKREVMELSVVEKKKGKEE